MWLQECSAVREVVSLLRNWSAVINHKKGNENTICSIQNWTNSSWFSLLFLLAVKAEFVWPDRNRCVWDRFDKEVLQRWTQMGRLQQEWEDGSSCCDKRWGLVAESRAYCANSTAQLHITGRGLSHAPPSFFYFFFFFFNCILWKDQLATVLSIAIVWEAAPIIKTEVVATCCSSAHTISFLMN